MRSPEILHDEICQRLDKIISILTEECQRNRVGEAVIRENEALREALQAIATGDRSAHEAMLWARQALREASHEG